MLSRRQAWPVLAVVLLGGLGLRLWGVAQGLPYAYNADEADHFVPKAIAMFGHNLNPHYFANPPAFTYVLHLVFAVWFGGGAGARHAFALHPDEVYTLARVIAALLGTAALWLLYTTGARLFNRGVGLLAAAIQAVAFLPVFYAHLALNDAPTLAPVTLSLLGSAGVLRKGRRRDYLVAGVGLGLACASKYTAGIVLLPLLAAAATRYLSVPPGARAYLVGRRAMVGLLLAGAGALVAFLVANPYAVLDFKSFHAELVHQSTLSAEAQGKLGAPKEGGFLYYLWSLTWGLGWLPALAALGGAVAVWRREQRLGWLLVPAPLLYLAFMGLQGRYFGRWLLPIFPILCLLAAFFALWLVGVLARSAGRRRRERAARASDSKSAAGAGGTAPGGSPRGPRIGLAALLVVALLAQGLLYSVHAGLVLSRADTRNLTRAWLVANVPQGRADRGRAGLAGRMGARSQARDIDRAQSVSLAEVPLDAVADLRRRRARGELGPPAESRDRGLRAHAQPGADRLLRAQRILLGGERLHAVRASVRRPQSGAAGDRLLRGARQAGRSRLSRVSLRARAGWAGFRTVRLRLEL